MSAEVGDEASPVGGAFPDRARDTGRALDAWYGFLL